MTRVAIIDYGLCNLDSIRRAVEICGGEAVVTAEPNALADANRLILPGVGAFGVAMANLKRDGMDREICRQVDAGIPLLGVCLGMQLLGSRSTENGDFAGLGLIGGDVVLLEPKGEEERVPHIGWNSVARRTDDPLFAGVPPDADFYFVHSYHFRCAESTAAIAVTPYCGNFTSVVRQGSVVGTQFHPEKSQRWGLQILKNFLAQ